MIDKGFAGGVLGTGAQAERHKRLRDLVDKKLAEDRCVPRRRGAQAAAAKTGDGLVSVGMKLVYAARPPRACS